MSSNQNALENMQRLLFAPVTQGAKEEIDLSDIFADYLNEGDDPLTTFGYAQNLSAQQQVQQQPQQQQQQQVSYPMYDTSGKTSTPLQMANAPVPLVQQQQPIMTLPTGHGIKTAFHAGVVGGGAASEHPSKKAKIVNQAQAISTQQQNQQPPAPLAAVPPVAPNSLSTTGSALSGRLGFSMMSGKLAMNNTNGSAQQAQNVKLPTAPGNIPLPVGVGIRLGGILPQAANTGGSVGMNSYNWSNGADGKKQGQNPYPVWNGAGGANSLGPGGMSEQAMAERRQRNREHAKRSRVRKKFLLESLQAEVRSLQTENEQLRMLIQHKIPEHAQKIIDSCCEKNPLFDEGGSSSDKTQTQLVKSDFNLIESLTSGQQNFVLSDPRLPDNPIVFASEGFYELTGYTREQVLGRNCRFLQGPGTDPKAVDVIRTAIANGTDSTTCILNYKADGTPFWNQFFVAALRDSENCIVNYVGVQCAVDPDAGASALEDKVNAVLPLQHKSEEQQ